MTTFRILDENYLFQDDVQISATSEDPNFPVSNFTKHFRSKIWRSTGFFVVTEDENKIDFDEGGGELTAVIPPGNYLLEDLAVEIATQMSLVGGDTYSVSYSQSTGIWTIESDGIGFDLLFLTGSNTAETFGPVVGYPVLDFTGFDSYAGTQVAIHTEEGILIDLAVTSPVDSFALVFDPMRDPVFSNQAVLTLQASQTNSWLNPAIEVPLTIDYDSSVATHFFSSVQNYRYWRLKIEDPHNPNLYVEVPKLVLSKATYLSQTPEMGFKNTLDDQSKETKTPYGHKYFDIYPIVRKQDFTFAFLPEADIQILEQIYRKLGNSVPLAVSLDSEEELFNKDRVFIYGRIQGGQTQGQKFTSFFDVNFPIEEAL